MRPFLRLRQLAIQKTWCQQRPYVSTAHAEEVQPSTGESSQLPLHNPSPLNPSLIDPSNPNFWLLPTLLGFQSKSQSESSPTTLSPPIHFETQQLHHLREVIHEHRPYQHTLSNSSSIWETYMDLSITTRRSLPLFAHQLILRKIVPPPPSRQIILAISLDKMSGKDREKEKGKGKERRRSDMMDMYRYEVDMRLRCVISDMGRAGDVDLLRIMDGLSRWGDVEHVEAIHRELVRRLEGKPADKDLRVIRLQTILRFLKLSLVEQRVVGSAMEREIEGIIWEGLEVFQKAEPNKWKMGLVTSCLSLSRQLFGDNDSGKRMDEMLGQVLVKIYGFERRYVRIQEDKRELWDWEIVAALIGYMARRGETWGMISVLENLINPGTKESWAWPGGYFVAKEVKPVTSPPSDDRIPQMPRRFRDFYPGSGSSSAMLSNLTFGIMMRRAAELEDFDLAIHIARMGFESAKAEQAKWLQDQSVPSARPPPLTLDQLPLDVLYRKAREVIKRTKHAMLGAVFRELHEMWREIAQRIEHEYLVLTGVEMSKQPVDSKEPLERFHGTGEQFQLEDYAHMLRLRHSQIQDIIHQASEQHQVVKKRRQRARVTRLTNQTVKAKLEAVGSKAVERRGTSQSESYEVFFAPT